MNNSAILLLLVILAVGGIWLFSSSEPTAKVETQKAETPAQNTVTVSPKEQEKPMPKFGLIAASQAKELLSSRQVDQIIDIRTPEEFAAGHIENAKNIDFYQDDFANQIGQLEKDKTYFMYCRSGNRSSQAAPTFLHRAWKKSTSLKVAT